ncbi:helix-turn-helix domain-containing protein [Candidatus Darwinibacter acetoxidans]|jgi:hypothetical protein
MPKKIVLELSESQYRELTAMRDHHPKPYMRERAAALLKVAAGQSARQVALSGLLRPRDPDTVYGWLHRYQLEGISGLALRPGRGRKPAFSPSPPSPGQRSLAYPGA